jgi:four helix bundle protein
MSNEIRSYKGLDVWLETRKLSKEIYNVTRAFPKEEQYGLVSQMRRCAISIPSNIAEGCGRNHSKDSTQFFFISRGSLYELETQLYLSFDLNYIDSITLNQLLSYIETCRKLLSGFIKYYQQLDR